MTRGKSPDVRHKLSKRELEGEDKITSSIMDGFHVMTEEEPLSAYAPISVKRSSASHKAMLWMLNSAE